MKFVDLTFAVYWTQNIYTGTCNNKHFSWWNVYEIPANCKRQALIPLKLFRLYLFFIIPIQAQWKAGKRRAEKDELIGGAFLTTIKLPNVTVDIAESYVKYSPVHWNLPYWPLRYSDCLWPVPAVQTAYVNCWTATCHTFTHTTVHAYILTLINTLNTHTHLTFTNITHTQWASCRSIWIFSKAV